MDHSKLKKSLTAPSFVKPSSPRHPSDYRLPTCCEKHFSPWCPLTHQLPAGSVWTGFGLPCPPSLIPEMGSLGLKGRLFVLHAACLWVDGKKGETSTFPSTVVPCGQLGLGCKGRDNAQWNPGWLRFPSAFFSVQRSLAGNEWHSSAKVRR